MIAGALGVFAAGLALGFLGAGGTSITLPVLVYLVGLEVHEAVAISILLVGGASAYGAVLHGWRGFVVWRVVAMFAPFGMVGALVGSAWSYRLSGRTLLVCFGVLVLGVALRMMLERGGDDLGGVRRAWVWLAGAGFGLGAMTGVLGNGGGFLLVPVLVYLAGLPLRQAVGTALVISTVNTAAAFAGHAARQALPWRMALGLLVCAVAGVTVGVGLSHRTEPARLRRCFAGLLLVLGGWMVWRNL